MPDPFENKYFMCERASYSKGRGQKCRTIKSLTLSYAESYRGWQKEPSRFLFEMGLLPA